MKATTRTTEVTIPTLQIFQESEEVALPEEFMELEDRRQRIEEEAQAEEFWAGRNLGGRKSTRMAA